MLHAVLDKLKSRLQPPYLRLAAGTVVAMGLTLAIVSYCTAKRGTSAVGIPWGADFAGFYVAAQILDQGEAGKLYDRELHARLYHELLPNLPKDEIIPYVHPPFVAGALRVLTSFDYDTAVALWLLITLVLYVSGTLLVLKSCPILDLSHRWLVLLLAVSFEPFLFECWMGGQLSAVAFFSYALAWYCYRRGWPLYAGLALGICFYKPTLLILVLPLFLLARQWKILAGMTITGIVLLLASVTMVGGDCTWSYLDVLLAFRKATGSHDGIDIRTWKYVDFNHFFELLIGRSIYKSLALVGVVTLCLGRFVLPLWSRWNTQPATQSATWAMTLFLIPLLNIYVGIYDSIFVIQGAILVTETLLSHRNNQPGSLHQSGWSLLLLLLAVTPWFSQYVAHFGGVQVYSLLLLLLAAFATDIDDSLRSQPASASSCNGASPAPRSNHHN